MKKAVLVAVAATALLAASVHAETSEVKTSDLNLSVTADIDKLTYRLFKKIRTLCGSKADAPNRMAQGLTRTDREACIEAVTINGGGVFQIALAAAKVRAH